MNLDHFLAENVIAIGWDGVSDASTMTKEEITKECHELWPDESDGQINAGVAQIIRFTQIMQEGDLVLLCSRYDGVGVEDKNVQIYGIARIISVDGQCYFYDEDSAWFRSKRHAAIQVIKQPLPRSLVAKALGVGSIVPTIKDLDQEGFDRLRTLLRTELGVVMDV